MAGIKLKPHQTEAVKKMHEKNGIFWLKGRVGCGKTVISIAYLQEVQAQKILVLAPKSIITQWENEIKKFYTGTAQWRVINYEKLLKDEVMRSLLSHMPDAIIADEITKIKSGSGKISKRFRKLQSRYRIGLAANLLPNNLGEMYSPVSWFNPGSLGDSFLKFQQRFCIFNPYIPQQVIAYRDEDKLIAYLKRFTVDVDWTGEGELPEATREIVRVEMTEKEKKLYSHLRDECLLELRDGGRITIPNVLSKLTRLVQLINDPELFSLPAGSKQAALETILHSICGRAIIFSEHSQVLTRLQKRHGGILYTGIMTARARTAALEAFLGSERYLWSSASGSRGLNLQNHAQTVIHYGLPYNEEAIRQRFGRVNRLGQTEPVKEIVLLTSGSCDERIWSIIESKKKLEKKFTREEILSLL